jgi:hypothetical protein
MTGQTLRLDIADSMNAAAHLHRWLRMNAGDFSPFEILLTVLSKPYEDQPISARFAEPPRPEQVVRQTFCGT